LMKSILVLEKDKIDLNKQITQLNSYISDSQFKNQDSRNCLSWCDEIADIDSNEKENSQIVDIVHVGEEKTLSKSKCSFPGCDGKGHVEYPYRKKHIRYFFISILITKYFLNVLIFIKFKYYNI
jgi:hypothetical protein